MIILNQYFIFICTRYEKYSESKFLLSNQNLPDLKYFAQHLSTIDCNLL